MFPIVSAYRSQLARFCVVLAGALVIFPGIADAITITMEYTDEGDTPPHPENPDWDPDGTILKDHFNAAKAIWEALIPGGGEYMFDFHWDDNLDPGQLAQTTDSAADTFIEVNPNQLWFADATPLLDEEFSPATQRLYSGLSTADQAFYFPDAAPPGALEVNYQKLGIFHGTLNTDGTTANTRSLSFQTTVDLLGNTVLVDASNGNDLLSTIVHEIGHVLGIGSEPLGEPGEFNIDPQHIGGTSNVTVLEGGGGHLGGGPVPPPATNIVPGFLMCNSCGVAGLRRFATATDVLVIAEDQGITVVQLGRVGSISSGAWSTASNWIGGDMPDDTQDVYITHGGVVTVDVGAQANNMFIASGNGLVVQTGQSAHVNGVLTFTGGSLTVGPDATLAANVLIGDPGTINTGAGSLLRFNQLTETAATPVNFGGSVAIGFDTNPFGPIVPADTTVNPSSAAWNIAENLIVSDQNYANLIVDNGTWTVGGDVAIGKVITVTGGGFGGTVTLKESAVMSVGGNVSVEGPGAEVIVEGTASLDIDGDVTLGKGGRFTYRDDQKADHITYFLVGGQAVYEVPPVGPPQLLRPTGGTLTFEGTASAGDATVIVEGGAGDEAPSGQVIFGDDSSAGDSLPLARALFRTKGGRRGPTLLPLSDIAGYGGVVRFGGTSGARDSTFINEGGAEYLGGTGGSTVFTQNSSAENSIIDNHGAAYFNAGGGATYFFGNSTADLATITNHATGASWAAVSSARTVFYDSSSAGQATIENAAASGQVVPFGLTEFRGDSSAANATIHNRGYIPVGGLAGRTFFYDQATADVATIHVYEGYSDAGRVEFRDSSSAADAHIFVNNVPSIVGSGGNGGHVIFRDNSTAANSRITLRRDACCNGIQFYTNATAANALIVTEDGAGGITFWGNSSAADATIQLGRGSISSYFDNSSAANAIYSLAGGAQVQFSMNSSAGSATIVADGSTVYPVAGGRVLFNSTSLVNNSTIVAYGGTAPLAAGATVEFINGAHAGNSKITAHGPFNGGTGARISFDAGAQGDNAELIVNAGASLDFVNQRFYGDGSTTVGSIEGAGTVFLRGSHLIVGSGNLSRTISGPITDANVPGGRLTKLGTGTLTLAGTNNYSGLTTVNQGTLSVTGSLAGGVLVESGATLNGTGTIGGTVTVNSGGIFSPGTSPGTMTLGGLTINSDGVLFFEIGSPVRDHIVLTDSGNVSLAGILHIALIDDFTPSLGQSFPLFEGEIGAITGAFQTIIVPTYNGLTFNIIQTADSLSLQVGNAPFLAGDYNQNGTVDAADYTVWRDSLGGDALINRGAGISGPIGDADYQVWKANFGQSLGAASAAVPAVPEPSVPIVLAMGILCLAVCRRC